MSEPARSARIALRQRALVALLVGFACMAAELTAVRLLAPHFGDSAYVWTNVIGVILVALAIGALVGGRLAATPRAAAHTRTALVVAGVALAVVPYATGALGGWLVPAELPLDAAMPALVRGSFVATVLAFGVPLGLLGAVSPLLVAASIEEGVPPGRAAGGLGAAGTFGSLLGTFLATHWLVPTLGCRIAMTVAAAVLAVAALLVPGRGGRRAAGLVLLATALAGLGHGGPLRSALPGRELLAEVESRSQFLQVLVNTSLDAPAYRYYGGYLVARSRETLLPMRLGLKDIELSMQAAMELDTELPTAALIRGQMLAAIADGWGDRDWAALGEWMDQRIAAKRPEGARDE